VITRLDEHRDQRGWDILETASGDLAFDIGANIGQSTRVLARNFAVVVALEPCAESFAILDEEMDKNVVCLPCAASDHDGHLTLDEAATSIRTGQLVTGPGLPMWGQRVGRRKVRAVTLDSLLLTYGVPDFVKVDVEGAECLVLAGGRRLFAEHHPAVHIEVHRAENEELVRALLPGYDLTKLTHGPYVRQGGEVHRNHFWMVSA
jgi:FkbM family methyltransferase